MSYTPITPPMRQLPEALTAWPDVDTEVHGTGRSGFRLAWGWVMESCEI